MRRRRDPTVRDECGDSALEAALENSAVCVSVLLANGMRLRSVRDVRQLLITPEMEALERGVLRCRALAVALLGLKRRRGAAMRALDRFLVREMALACWCTRAEKPWQ